MKQLYSIAKRSMTTLFLIGIFCSMYSTSKAQALDSKGTDFWLTFAGNYNGGSALSFFISADQNTSGTVTIPGLGFSAPFTVTVGTVTTVNLPAAADLGSPSNTITNKGIHVVSNQEVTVYGLSRLQFTTDAYLGLPTDILGTQYIVLGYKNSDVVNGTQFAIVATANATTVTITPSLTTDGHAGGVPYNVILNQGQTYQVRNTGSAPSDLSGSIVASDKPIAVFGGHQCANIPPGAFACDFVVEELPPTSAWGKNFVTVPLKTRVSGDTFRFLASNNGTEVRVNGSLVATLNRGQLYETLLTVASQITSTQPILVAQYSNGTTFDNVTSDPFMMLITPYEQFLGNYTFATPASGFRFNFVNIAAPAAAVGALRLDGAIIPASAFTPIGSTGFSRAQLDLTLGAHTLNGTNLPFGIFVYGFDDADSYGYPGGQSLAPIATVTSLVLTPETGTANVGTEQCFDALVKDQFGNPVIGVRVDFNITGANPGSTGFTNTNASGIAHFCYTGAVAGTDNIIASVGSINDASSFIWTSGPVSSVYYSKSTGDLHNVLTWGLNPDGSGPNPPDFTAGKTFMLANRPGIYTLTANWTVGGILNIPAGSQLQIVNFTLSIADITGAGTFSGTTSSNLVVTTPAGVGTSLNFLSTANNLNNLTIASTATTALIAPLNIYGVLAPQAGTFNTANALTLKSTASNTARVAPVAGIISGSVTVERYIPARRAWRIMSAPVDGSQTINAAWQEGATTSSANPNPNPGYGTHITEGSAASGLDHNPYIAMSSIKTYISSIDNWVPLLNTNSLHVNADAYMLFVRGDRGIDLGYNTVPPTSTTLRAMGPLKVGDQNFPVSATGFTAIPNPFASPINFATLAKTNVQSNFYLWDPKMGGTDGVGGYVLLSFNGVGYDVIPAAVSPESQYIQSGQGFLVHSTGVPGNILIKESDKSATPATDVFRVANNTSTTPGLRVNLQSINADNTTSLLDEVLASYGANYSDKVDNLDAPKVPNIDENLAIVRAGTALMVDRSAALDKSDTIRLKVWNTTAKRYLLEFNPANISASVSTAYLLDNYLKTSTPVALNKISQLYFTTSTDPASVNENRFMIVFNSPAETATMLSNRNGIITYPNPVEGKTIQLMLNDQPQGTYKVELVNGLGQVVYKTQLVHGGGSAIQKLQLVSKPASGVYMLNISNSATVRNTLKIVIK